MLRSGQSIERKLKMVMLTMQCQLEDTISPLSPSLLLIRYLEINKRKGIPRTSCPMLGSPSYVGPGIRLPKSINISKCKTC